MNYRGFLLFELLISLALFFFMLGGFLVAFHFSEKGRDNFIAHLRATKLSLKNIDTAYQSLKTDFYNREIPGVNVVYENDASLMIISGKFKRRITNPDLALGQSTCADSFDSDDIYDLHIRRINISLGEGNIPTDIDVVGKNVFISADSAVATDTDMFIYELSDYANPILEGKLNTGPGLAAIQVVGNYVFGANQSINGQLQIINTIDLNNPILTKTIKIPGTYSDNTAVGQKVVYGNKKLFLATGKSSIAELQIFDAEDLGNPVWKSSYEIGSGPNDLMPEYASSSNYLLITTPSDPELISLDVTDINHPKFVDSFDAPTGSGNGKSLDRYDSSLFMGRTIGNNELFTFKLDNGHIAEDHSGMAGTSINNAIYKDKYIFVTTSKTDDPFEVFTISSSTIFRFLNTKFPIPSRVLAMDCDQKTFYLLTSDPLNPLYQIS